MTKEQRQYLKDNVKGKSSIELAELLNKEFGTNYSYKVIANYKKNNAITSDIRCHYTGEIIQFVKKNIKGKTCSEMAELLNKEFSLNCKSSQIKYLKKRFGLRSELDCRFKKGQSAHNYKPIGYEFVQCDGYIYVKIAEPNTWVKKHRYIWEKYYGKIPKGYRVAFKDQNRQNCEIDNLILVSKKDFATMAGNKLFSNSKELTETGFLIAQLINKTKEKNLKLNNQ